MYIPFKNIRIETFKKYHKKETTNVELTPMDLNKYFKMSWYGDMCALSTNKTET